MENDPCIDDFLIKTSIYSGFSMAMLNNQMVSVILKALFMPQGHFLGGSFLSVAIGNDGGRNGLVTWSSVESWLKLETNRGKGPL